MQATRYATRFLPDFQFPPVRSPKQAPAASTAGAGHEPTPSALERWTDRFCAQLVAWGDGATHRRLGSWTRR